MERTHSMSLALFLMWAAGWAAPAFASTTTYEFLPDQSTVMYRNWSWGYVKKTCSVVGEFRLTIDRDAGVASFEQVDAELSEEMWYLEEDVQSTQSLADLFHMTELKSTDVNDIAIKFVYERNDPTFPYADVHLTLTFTDNSVHLAARFSEACCDCGQFDLDAVALKKSTVYYVDDDGPADFNNIQAAIDDSNDGDTVIVKPGRYTGPGNRDIDFLSKAITVRGLDPNDANMVAATIIDCNGTEDDPHRGFKFHCGEGESSVLSGLTITNGYGPDELFGTKMLSAGGAIFCVGSSPRIKNCNITANSAAAADGICCLSSNPDISHCSILGTPAANLGGGIHLFDSNAVITHCTIANHSSPFNGAGIFCDNSDPIISYCVIAHNSVEDYGDGGAIFMSRGVIPRVSTPTITHCIISGNSVKDGNGGGIYCGSTTSPRITHCVITQNSASHVAAHKGRGGGIACGGSKEPNVSQCIISENSATNFGGGIFCHPTSAKIVNCTITNNSADQSGGGFYYVNTNFTNVLSNCILWHNAAPTGPQIGGRSKIGGSTVSYNNIQGGFVGEGNIDADPLFADSGNADYHLKSQAGRWEPSKNSKFQTRNSKLGSGTWVQDDVTSPCIDAGNPTDPVGHELFPNGGIINMGAFGGTVEASKSYFGEPVCETIVAGDINGDCKVDFADFAFLALRWLEENQ